MILTNSRVRYSIRFRRVRSDDPIHSASRVPVKIVDSRRLMRFAILACRMPIRRLHEVGAFTGCDDHAPPPDRFVMGGPRAKVNLYLRVIGKRPDGYHDIETVMTAVDLYDTLIFSPSPTNEVALRVVRSECGRRRLPKFPKEKKT